MRDQGIQCVALATPDDITRILEYGEPVKESTASTRRPPTTQQMFVAQQLIDIGVRSAIRETVYFDRDFLAEYAAYHATSVRSIGNRCQRLHFFKSEASETERAFNEALGAPFTAEGLALATPQRGSPRTVVPSVDFLQRHYSGFAVIRPLGRRQFGRTVLEPRPWRGEAPKPLRRYDVHVAGIPLHVFGLAWQQQDRAVSVCATIATWTLLHSAAFDDGHAVPTTVDLSRVAHDRAPQGRREFPSSDWPVQLMLEAIRGHGLAPERIEGRQSHTPSPKSLPIPAFSRDAFTAALTTLLRSGYACAIVGRQSTGHALVLLGFERASLPTPRFPGEICFRDRDITHVYGHNDNIGPGVRYRIDTIRSSSGRSSDDNVVRLRPDLQSDGKETKAGHFDADWAEKMDFVPSMIIAAVPEELRLGVGEINVMAHEIGEHIHERAPKGDNPKSGDTPAVVVGTRFCRIHEYLGEGLGGALKGDSAALRRVRRVLAEEIGPMSRHLGVVRAKLDGKFVFDAIVDTTSSRGAPPIFAHVLFDAQFRDMAASIQLASGGGLGRQVLAQ